MNLNVGTTAFACIFSFIITIIERVNTLSCIQCDRQGEWYSPEENERHILRCQRGHIASTLCSDPSHTHCIYSYYKQAGVVTITERRCGTTADITGCTIYKSTAGGGTSRRLKMRRHLIGGAQTDTPLSAGGSFLGTLGFGSGGGTLTHANTRRRDATPLLVEVCTSGCQGDGCTSTAGRLSGVVWTLSVGITTVWLGLMFRPPLI